MHDIHVCYRSSAFLQVFHEVLLVLQCRGGGSSEIFPCSDTTFYFDKGQGLSLFCSGQFPIQFLIGGNGYCMGIAAGLCNGDKINIGCKVKLLDVEYDEEMEFFIVGSTEANSLQNKISNEAPVGRALIGKSVGDVVDVETQAGIIQYKVLEIQRVS
mgnify:CR=1 FL=1